MPVQPVPQTAEPREPPVLRNGQRQDVAHAPLAEVSGRGVMGRVRAAPDVVGRERDHADHAPDPVAESAVPEEGRMAAVVLDHEEPGKERSVQHGQRGGENVADVDAPPRERPEHHEGANGYEDLEDASPGDGSRYCDRTDHPVAGRPRLRDGARRGTAAELDRRDFGRSGLASRGRSLAGGLACGLRRRERFALKPRFPQPVDLGFAG